MIQLSKKYSDSSKMLQLANCIRFLSIDAVEKSQSGHPGMPMGMADIATVLFSKHLKFNPLDPQWVNRDRFILSNGHGSMLLYSLLYLTGYKNINLDDLKNFRQLHSNTAGHPERNPGLGIETTTGPLAQGLGNAVGIALAEKLLHQQFGEKLIDYFTYVFVGDGCLMEGLSQEVISFAGHHHLNKLIVFFDDNQITIDGSTDLSTSEDHTQRFKANNWDVFEVDGHDFEAINHIINKAKTSPSPSLIKCKTIIGYGSPNKQGLASCHGAPLGQEEVDKTRKNLNWNYGSFEIPKGLLAHWRNISEESSYQYQEWQKTLKELSTQEQKIFSDRLSNTLSAEWKKPLEKLKIDFLNNPRNQATRQSSGEVLQTISSYIPELIGGSADLSGSNNTKSSSMKILNPQVTNGNYIHYGIREHGMASIMNGLRINGGFLPYGGTFLCFSDYCRPAIRLSALMNLQVIYIFSHDSIGLGEDGPTHQPIEHLASLRAMPNICIFRPCDALETAECWEIALELKDQPSVIVLSRQTLPSLRKHHKKNQSSFGAYTLSPCSNPEVTLIATGSEVYLASLIHKILDKKNINSQVVSMPCWELFSNQSQNYQKSIIPSNTFKVSIEASSSFGWEKFSDRHFGIDKFGASGKASDLFNYFGLQAKDIAEQIIQEYKRKIS